MITATNLSEAERTDVRRFCGYAPTGLKQHPLHASGLSANSMLLERRLMSLTPAELNIARRYIATLTSLELAIPRAADNLDTDQAAVWSHNKNEVRDRTALFEDWRRRLCGFLGIGYGAALVTTDFHLIV